MKTILYYLLFALGATQITTAQEKNTHYGVFVGANYSKFTESKVNKETSAKLGYQFGVLVDFKIYHRFHLQTELSYSRTVTKSYLQPVSIDPATAIGPITNSAITSLQYVNLPILVKLFITDQISIQLGPQVSYLLGSKLLLNLPLYEYAINYNDDYTIDNRTVALDNYNKYDISIKLGMTYSHKTGLFGNISYNYGLTNLINSTTIIPQSLLMRAILSNNESLKNRGLFFSVGYMF